MATKYFTVDEANKTLPLVRRIVQDIVDDYERWKESLTRYELIAAGDTPDAGESPAAVALRQDVDEIAQRINGYIDELKQIGCVLKGFDDGLVDFYSKAGEREIFLCWRLGEDRVGHWHELDAGFAGRQPLIPEVVGGGSDS